MSTIAGAVVFDWDGSLTLARTLWSVADQLEHVGSDRRLRAEHAAIDWTGSYAVQFADRIDAEQVAGSELTSRLRGEAADWAKAWSYAIDQENWHRFQVAAKRVRDSRSVADRIGGFFGGHDDLPPNPTPAEIPAPPHFAATAAFADYSAY